MNIYRPQKPYVFRPPRHSRFWAPLLVGFGRIAMRPQFNLRSVRVTGAERVAALHRAGHGVLIAPNHADHADPVVLLTVGRRHGLALHFMAARDAFESGRIPAFAMQRVGAFSVDREGADVAAIKTALQILRAARFPLAIFPEGEIWHHHETLDVFNEGVAAIALRAAEGAEGGRPCHVVPTALRYRNDPSVAASFSARLDALERRIWWKPRPDLPVVERIYRLGGGLLATKEEEHLGHAQPGALGERIRNLQERVVEQVESRQGKTPAEQRIPERVRGLRQRIRRKLLDAEAPPDEAAARAMYEDLDRLFLVVQLYSYPVPYIAAEPSADRIAETIFKLEEDIFGRGAYPAPRAVHVRFGEPIDLAAHVRERGGGGRAAAAVLTRRLAEAIAAELSAAD